MPNRPLSDLISTDAQAALAAANAPGTENAFVTKLDIEYLEQGPARALVTTEGEITTMGGASPLPDRVLGIVQGEGSVGMDWIPLPRSPTLPYIDPADFISDSLTPDNFEDAFHNAIDYALSLPTGGVVLIPRGRWPMTRKITIPACGGPAIGQGFGFHGEATNLSVLDWSNAQISGPLLDLDGRQPSQSGATGDEHWPREAVTSIWIGFADFRDFTIVGNGAFDYAFTTGPQAAYPMTGLRLNLVLQSRFTNIAIRHCKLGMNVDSGIDEVGEMICQNLYFDNVTIANCYQGARLQGLNHGTFAHCVFNQMLDAELTLGGANQMVSLESCMFQSGHSLQTSASITTDNPDPGNNAIRVTNVYHEGPQPAFLQVYPPAETAVESTYHFDGVYCGGYDTLADVDSLAYLRVGTLYYSPVSKFIKARKCGTIHFERAPDPEQAPGWYDVDDFSRSGLNVDGNYDAPPYSGGISRATTMTELLRPYAVEIFDPSLAAYRTVPEENLVSLTGLLHGTVWSAPEGREPGFDANNPAFNGQATFHCIAGDTSILRGALAKPVAIGKHPGLFVVWKFAIPVTATSNSGCLSLTDIHQLYGAPNQTRIGYSDNTVAAGYIYTTHYVGGAAVMNTPDQPSHLVQDFNMLNPHACLWVNSFAYKQYGSTAYALYDNTLTPGAHGSPTYAPASAPMENLYIGFSDTTSSTYPTVEIAYVAVLDAGMPQGVARQLMERASDRYGFALTRGEL